jgi:cell division protein FtsL
LKIEKEREVLRLEWERLKKAVAAWKESSEVSQRKRKKAKKKNSEASA